MDDQIREDIQKIKIDIAEIKVDVRYHIKRTDQNEEQIEILKKQHDEIIGAVKFIKIIGVVAAIAEAIHLIWS